MEKVAAQSLDQIIRERVTAPLGLDSIGYGPIPREMAAPTEYFAHQNRRMCGEVHDENAWSFVWVVDAPLFKPTGEDDDVAVGEGAWTAVHHAFTSPTPEWVDRFEEDPGNALAQYELIPHGSESGPVPQPGKDKRQHGSAKL